ncbi:MAG: arsenate reductase family protein [Ruminococcus sp.]|nr:arsenate reductase family protein [Ruminococcus sp.]
MNIQIFGTKKCSDTRKAERWFKERRIKYQMIDMKEKGMSRGEFNSIKQSVGGTDSMIDENCRDKELVTLIKYLSDSDREEKILENQHVIITPIVRNGKKATVGYCPEIWKNWD